MRAALTALLLLSTPALGQTCPMPPDADAQVQAIGQGLNGLRRAGGLPALDPAPPLMAAARAHACDMARTGRFAHEGARGSTLSSRLRDAGACRGTAAENIAFGYPDAAATLQGWDGSDGHRRNMLNRDVTAWGAAVATGGDGRPYWVLVLGCR